MKQQSKKMAVCSVMAALGVVVMLLGAVIGLGMYACPMLVGLCLIPVGREYGVKYQLILWIVISILSLLLIPNPEENLMFAGWFGWYPAVYPKLEKLPKGLRMAVKLILFNGAVVAIESLIVFVLVPEAMDSSMLLVLLLLGNAMFLLYDRVIPKFEQIIARYWKRIR